MKISHEISICGVSYRVAKWTHEHDRGLSSASGLAGRSAVCPSARPVVLLHGFAQSADTWDDVAVCFAAKRVVYALDFVGHGKSERPDNPAAYNLDAQCDALLAFLLQVQQENNGYAPAIVAYSMGGRVALASLCRALREGWLGKQSRPCLTADAALPFGSLVLESAGLGPENEEERSALERRNRTWATNVRDEGVAAFMNRWKQLPLFATQDLLPIEVQKQVHSERLDNDAEALARTLERSGAHVMPLRGEVLAVLDFLAEVDVSVLYVAGACDEKYRTVAQSILTSQATKTPHSSLATQVAQVMEMPHVTQAIQATKTPHAAQVQCVEGAGHNVHLEAPEQFVAIVEDFLAQ